MAVADPESTEKFWQLPVAALKQRLGAGTQGLAAGEAAARLKTFGPNKLRAGPHLSLLFKVASRFRNPLVLILLVAAAISAATGELPSFVIISSIVTISILLDSVQEFRAEQAKQREQAQEARIEQEFATKASAFGERFAKAIEAVAVNGEAPVEPVKVVKISVVAR